MSAPRPAGGGVIPTGLPRLARGRHTEPDTGSCLMEYVSVLAGRRFSDHPRCTHPLLGWLARRVNDAVSDGARAQLVAVAPALIGTRTRHRGVRVMIYGQIARAGLAAAPGDRWLREFDDLTRDHLARLGEPHSEHRPVPTSRRWGQPLLTIDRNFAFGCLSDVLDTLDTAERDLLLLGLLAGSVHDYRRCLGLPTVPAETHETITSSVIS